MFPLRFDPSSITQPHLLTIRHSHYCELARWAMDASKLPYQEIMYALACHLEPIGLLRADPDNRSSGSYPGLETGADESRRQHSVPLVCLPGGRILRNSWEILAHYVAPISPFWLKKFDSEFAPAIRRIAYQQFLDPDRPELTAPMFEGMTDQERLFWDQAGEGFEKRLVDLMGISPQAVARDQAAVEALFEELSADRPPQPEGPGDVAGMSWWIAFSSLGAFVVLPPEYGGSAWRNPPIETFSPAYRSWVERLRSTPAGRDLMEFYARER